MKILVVDEFSANRRVIINMLKELGFDKTFEVSDGYSAIVNLKSAIFDCVIAEWDMLEMSGLELLKHIREDSFLQNTPVLIVMEDGLIEDTVSAYKAGVNVCISRPFKKDVFLEAFKKLFKK